MYNEDGHRNGHLNLATGELLNVDEQMTGRWATFLRIAAVNSEDTGGGARPRPRSLPAQGH
eukprot:8143100-Alexandrium_andersonii.AAC.1